MFPKSFLDDAGQLLSACQSSGLWIVTAESCTGGLVGALLTAVAGSSAVYERGFVTYSNAAKQSCLGVDPALIDAHGAVSEEVAAAMAQGAVAHSEAGLSVAVTGIAGPGGGGADKPVGLVFVASHLEGGETLVERSVYAGDRDAVRLQSVESAVALMLRQARTC